MAKLFSYISLIFWVSLSMVCGLFLFVNGFFLRKNVMTTRSNCSSFDSNNLYHVKDPLSIATECSKPSARIILLIVDALKHEFVAKFHDAASASTFHRNKVPIISETLQHHPKNSKLLKFIADPPTTTMQRLKSITTGTLPTFIDIHDNFAADAIMEDNFIDLNHENGNVFMGDDTWTNLYPNKFLRSYPAPSFDVSDLDTVDTEVKKRMFTEIENADWTLLVGHILGIDHCGHKHGMHHPEMLRKLNETNFFIQDIIEKINESKIKTILFVVGDHGMTDSGDHGGDSLDETEAAMFVYSNSQLIDISTNFDIEKKSGVNQIDIVPTISVILGIPIPFSNIGNLIIEALPSIETKNSQANNLNFILHSLWRNIFQVQYYIDAYSSENYLSDKDKLDDIKKLYNELLTKIELIKTNNDLKDFVNLAQKYFAIVRETCYEVWVQFDPTLMTRGLLLIFCATFLFFIVVTGLIGKRLYTVLESSFLNFIFFATLIILSLCLILYYLQVTDFENNSMFFCGLVPVLSYAFLLIQNWDYVSNTWYENSQKKKSIINILSRLILVALVFGVFSNSYIIEENKILSYFLITIFCFLIYSLKTNSTAESIDKKGRSLGKSNKKIFYISMSPLLVFLICLLIRISNYFWRQREEQKQYVTDDELNYLNFVIGKAGSMVSKDKELTFVSIAITSLALYVTIIKIWLRDCGNLSGYSPCETLARFCPRIIVLAISCYWILKLEKIAKLSPVLLQRVNLLPLFIYVLFAIALLIIFYRPLSVFLLPKEKENISVYREETSVPKLYEKIKNILYKKKNEDENEMPIVFGLGTVYSACYVLLGVFLCLVYTLLLGFVIAPSTILMNLVCIGLLYVSAMDRLHSAQNLEELLHVPNPPILCWFLIAEYFFYATGHQPSFPTIHWDAGFIGIDGSWQITFPRAILIGINTFGSHIILGMMLPLLVIVPFTLRLVFPNLVKSSKTNWEDIKRGELVLFQNDYQFHSAIFSVSGKYIIYHAIRVFMCMLAATVHCRHLMVWKIFAPKLIFEGISFIVTVGSVLTSLLLLFRIENRIEKLISHII